MILFFHILIALMSLASTTYAFFLPSKLWIRLSAAFITLTLASGTYIVWITHSPLLASCTTGLIYISAVCFGIVSAKNKLACEDKTF